MVFSKPTTDRKAFTRMELVVVAALLTISVGVLFPQVQRVRSAAARMQSLNNLKQMGLACHNYNDATHWMPPHYGPQDAGRFAQRSPTGSFFFHVLPYIEQDNLYRSSLDRQRGLLFGWNVWKRDVAVYRAEADPTHRKGLGLSSYSANRYVLANYPGFGRISIGRLPDGTSNTIMMVEQAAVKRYCGSFENDNCATTIEQHNLWANNRGNSYYPLRHSPAFDVSPKPEVARRYVPTAFDSRGLNVVLFDGSTRTISPKVSTTTWIHAGMHNDGAALDHGEF